MVGQQQRARAMLQQWCSAVVVVVVGVEGGAVVGVVLYLKAWSSTGPGAPTGRDARLQGE